VRPRTIIVIAALSGALGGFLPRFNMARLHDEPMTSAVLWWTLGGAVLASSIVVATVYNLPAMLRLAGYARWLVAALVVLLAVGAVFGHVFGLH
jgi:hypothetical protein